ncbi:MAG: YbjN domain-containing protein [Nocardioidaceae bacterium]|nr:YbjN domain-containing protein [Nocardioidaceae bacterium]
MTLSASSAATADVVRDALATTGLEHVEHRPGVFEVVLPGEKKLQTTARLEVKDHSLSVHAFVARHPDENHAEVYRWLLERNMKLYGVAFAIDHNGDIWLDGRLPRTHVTAEEVDRLLGAVLTYADESFNSILELGFATSIRKEWEWRISRGESTRNLDAFRGWLEKPREDGSR